MRIWKPIPNFFAGVLLLFLSTLPPCIDAQSGAKFLVTVENTSQDLIPIAWTPGLWYLGNQPDPLFVPDSPILTNGLEALAEDGNPTPLHQSLGDSSGTFGSSLINPGQTVSFEIIAVPGEELSIASKLAQSNDVFVSNDQPVALFDSSDEPLPLINASASLRLWDAGTEANQSPLQGPDQPPRQSGPDTGAEEGSLRIFSDSTRAMPRVSQFLDFAVVQSGGSFDIEVLNITDSPIEGISNIPTGFWALTNEQHRFFESGATATSSLEDFAEDGNEASTIATLTGDPDVGATGSVNPVSGTTQFTVTPTPEFGYFNLAFFVSAGNDMFIAAESPIALTSGGSLIPAETVRQSLLSQLQVWDAGTEANQSLGLGGNQALRQTFPGQGPTDPISFVRAYLDAGNDLSGPLIPDTLNVAIAQTPGELQFRIDRFSQSSDTSFLLSPLIVIRHTTGTPLLDIWPAAYAQWFELGNSSSLEAELENLPNVISVDIVNATLPGGDIFEFQLSQFSSGVEYLSLASALVPSNDSFVALPLEGVALTDSGGSLRPVSDLESEFTLGLRTWDAGTEANEPGGIGVHQLALSGSTGGSLEGNGLVRLVDDPVWVYPSPADAIQIQIQFIDTIVFKDGFE